MGLIRKEDCVIYLDMDNTLVLFSTRESEEEQLKKMYNKGFYRSLPPMYGAFMMIEVLNSCGLKVKVISGLIDSPYVRDEKIEWCKSNLLISKKDVILCPMNHRKVDYVGEVNRNTILLDDYPRYVNEWRSEGGTGVFLNRKATESGILEICKLYDFLLVVLNMVDLTYDDKMNILDVYFDLKERETPKVSRFRRGKRVHS